MEKQNKYPSCDHAARKVFSVSHSQHSLKQRNENQLPSVDIGCLHTLGWKCFWDYLHVIYNTYKHLLFSNFSSHKYGHISAILFK